MVEVAAVVVAAGRGLRAGGIIPKQFRAIGGEPILGRTLSMLLEASRVGLVQPVIRQEDRDLFEATVPDTTRSRLLSPVAGGATRQASVRAGLAAIEHYNPAIVLIHDGARPFASRALVERAIAAAERTGAAIPALPIADTIKTVDAAGMVHQTLDRAGLRSIQTPQAFAFKPLLDAHLRAAAQNRHDFTDDAALAEWAGMTVATFEGEPGNVKITNPDDFARAEAAHFIPLSDVRTGTGIDVHACGPGDHVTLGGIKLPHTHALTGHSDADVALHAIVDAILGALADGDIGAHFPPSDPQWKGASSDRFLTFAVERVKARGGVIAHLDLTLICETPKIGPYRDAMRQNIARLAGVSIDRVAIKATTSERLGFTGRGEGIAAFATATLRLPWT